MVTGWRYRVASTLGVILLTAGAVLVANHYVIQWLFTTYVPLFNRLDVTVLTGESLYRAIALSVVAVAGSLVPLYKPQPRRVLDIIFLSHKRVLVAGLALATLGYFKWSHRLPRATLVMTIGTLSAVIPAWFVWICRTGNISCRTLVVGDNPEQIARTVPSIDIPILGYLCPSIAGVSDDSESLEAAADGGTASMDDVPVRNINSRDELSDLPRLGGLSRFKDILLEYDVDTVVLAFQQADREEFFGALDACHEHGVNAKVHRNYADNVLVSEGDSAEVIDVDLEPWDPLDHLFKRSFDILFAATALLALAPVVVIIAIAIKLDSSGPVLYKQQRTAVFGESFSIYKFRSMVKNAELETGAKISEEDSGDTDPRVTRVGRILRKTHLDEIPQFWSVLIGKMSVVGPRPERPVLDSEIHDSVISWRKRWFVKPGLTGLAQINDATGHEPKKKLRYDLEYVRKRSLWFDLEIVIRQVWSVLKDLFRILHH